MIIYLENKSTFRKDVFANRIEEKVRERLKGIAGKSVSESELNSWKNSLRYMDAIVEDADIPNDTGIAIEFNIPSTSKRIDFILTGKQADGTRTAWIEPQERIAKREGKIVLVQHREIQDPAYAGSYTIKAYHSEKVATDEGWQHQKIVLQPRSDRPEFDPIYFDASTPQGISVLGEFVTTL
jgi:hypothetical protein